MNSFVIAVLLFAVGQVAAHGYSPYKKSEGDNFLSNGDRQNDDGVDLGQLFNPDSETGRNSDENGHGRPTLGVFKKPQQHYRRNYQDQNYQGGQYYPEQGMNFGQQDWRSAQHKINPQDYHLGSATGQFLEQEQQIFGGGKKQRVFHPYEQQEGGRFVVNQQRYRGNQEDSNESDSVEKKNSVRQSYPGYF